MEEITIPDTEVTKADPITETVESTNSFDLAGNLLHGEGKTVQNEHIFDMLFNAYRAALSTVIEVLPESRAKSLAKTALEESHMWAKKAVNS